VTENRATTSHSNYSITASSIGLIVALWLATRPYYGLIHDARFYMVEALHALDPARFADDLYFRFGSQDQFTIFSHLYAPLVAGLGVANAAIAATLLGQVLFLAGVIAFVHAVLRPGRTLWLALAGAIALPSAYLIFTRYGEPFATPRLFAEGLSLFALACIMRGRIVWAMLLLALSAALHPLETLPALMLALVYLALARPVCWLLILGGAAAGISLAFVGVRPFANLRVFLDPEWLAIVMTRNSQNFVSAWGPIDDVRTLGTFALVGIALRLAQPQERRLLAAALIVAVGGIAVSLLGGDWLHDLFIAEIQPWRALWLLALIANLFALPSFLRLVTRRSEVGLAVESFAVALILLFASHFAPPLIIAAAPLMIVVALVALWQLGPWRVRHLGSIVCVPVAALAVVAALLLVYETAINGFFQLWPELLRPGLYALAVTLGILAVLAKALGPAREVARRALPVLAAALVLAALYGWDARPAWTRFAESVAPPPTALTALLRENGSIYWEGGLEANWFRLRRPDYFSCDQGTEALFFRDLALSYRHRAESFARLGTLDFGNDPQCPAARDPAPRSRATAAAFCAREPALDLLILARPVEGLDAKEWTPPVPLRQIRVVNGRRTVYDFDRFYVYSCAALR
jgi:hypothetical protein